MKLWHCTKCHHEWEGRRAVCDWCHAPGKVLRELINTRPSREELKRMWEEKHG